MLAVQRRAAIVDVLARQGAASVEHLAERLGVSLSTVRRDLDELERDRVVRRVHGGAVLTAAPAASPAAPDAPEPAPAQREVERSDAKRAVAAAAVALIEPGSTVLVTGGTTTAAMLPALALVPDVVVVTNSLDVAVRLSGRDVDLILLAGSLRRPELSLLGHLVPLALAEVHVDHVVTGVYGVDVRSGLLGASAQECETDRHIARSASRLTVLADGDKFTRRSPHRIVGVEAITELVTTEDAPPADIAHLRQRGVDVRVAPPGDADVPLGAGPADAGIHAGVRIAGQGSAHVHA